MEGDQAAKKGLKLEIPSETELVVAVAMEFQAAPASSGQALSGGLTRQTSVSKGNCLCSPTTHAGSFRCRLHRAPSLQRTKSIDSAALRDTASKTSSNSTAAETDSN